MTKTCIDILSAYQDRLIAEVAERMEIIDAIQNVLRIELMVAECDEIAKKGETA